MGVPNKAGAALRVMEVLVLMMTVTAVFGGGESAAQHFVRAGQLAQGGKIPEAEQEYRLGLALDPQSAEAYNNLAALYFQQHQFREAATAFGKAHDLRPHDPTISFNLGLALFNAGEPQSALAPLETGISDPTHAVDAQYLLGVCYFDLKQWNPSIRELEAVRRSRPDDERVLFILAKDYQNIGAPAQSLETASRLLTAHPDSLYAHEMLGEAYDLASQPEKAEKEFKQALAESPQTPELHLMLGYLYWRWKRYADAIEPLEAETRISPNLAQPYFYLGDVALRNTQYDAAEKYFRTALRLKPSYGEAELGMGRALAEQGQNQQALPYLRLAAVHLPDREEAHYWLGKTLVRAGQPAEGQRELAESQRLNRLKQQKASQILHDAATSPAVPRPAAPWESLSKTP